MGNLRASLSVALFALIAPAACGNDSASTPVDALIIVDAADLDAAIDAAPPVDAAPTYDFSCAANLTAPTTAPNPISLAGVAQEIVLDFAAPNFVAIRAAQNATIAACTDDCQQPAEQKGSATSGTTGAFSITGVDTNAVPLDGYLTLSKTGNQPTRVYSAYPIADNVANIPGLMMSSMIYNNLGQAGVTQTPGRAVVGAFLQDCAGTPVGGATLTITRNGTSLGTFQDTGSFAAEGAGGYLAFDIVTDPTNAADATVITASYMGTTFLSRTVRTLADTLTLTQMKPGYPN